jgi:hypothetical protein
MNEECREVEIGIRKRKLVEKQKKEEEEGRGMINKRNAEE